MKKVLKVCMCGMMAVMLVAGCSKKADSDSTSAPLEPTTETSSEPTTETSAESDSDSVTLGNYMGVTYTPESAEVTDEAVEAEIQSIVNANPLITEVDRAAKDGDIVNIDYVGMKDGVAFEGGTANGHDLTLGSGSFIDGFEDGLIGAVKGQELSLNLTFPEAYQSEELAGQDVVFDVTVNSVKESTPAELTDEFVNDNTEYGTVDEYRATLKADMIAAAEENAEMKKKSDVFMKVMDDSQITVSEATIEAYYNEQLAVYESQAQQAGIDLATLVSFYGMTEDMFKEQLRFMSEEATRQNALVTAIAEKENITVTEEDRDQLAVEFGYESKDAMIESAGETVVDNYILTEKVVTLLADNAVAA